MEALRLSRAFYEQPTVEVARQLLGKYLVRIDAAGVRAGMILETEAYVGPDDKASHASRGRTPRTSVMFGPAGFAYVYLVYGMHHCLNVVTEQEGYPAAVLIRAVEPSEGMALMQKERPAPDVRRLTNGPGKLCQAFGIDRRLNGLDMCGEALFVEDLGTRLVDIVVTTRVGVDYAGPWKDKPWRFYIAGHPGVSIR
ncbi:MAG: DNA-3-methyladenine glycosylase [Candidatus Tectomicrobia bacterium]|nr:DNA-3-methyladenine glycosylase [Candidatus Tectomicrobia bacterium]HEX2279461.1 DNA-3-methyladenine glycosylase [Candidatus Tectomicrobia bacterium]